MSKERIGIILDVDAEISKAKGNISSLTKLFDGIGGTKGNQLRDILSDINAEYEKLANESGKSMSKIGDFTKAEKSAQKLDQLFGKLEKGLEDISKASGKDASKFFPSDVADKVKKASDAIKTYNTILENSSKKKGTIGTVANEYKKQVDAVNKAKKALKDLEDVQQGKSKKQLITFDDKTKFTTQIEEAKDKAKALKDVYKDLKKEMDAFKKSYQEKADKEGVPSMFDKGTENSSKPYRDLRDKVNEAEVAMKQAAKTANDLEKELKDMVVVENLDNDIKNAKDALKAAERAAEDLKQQLDGVTATEFTRALDEAKKKLEGLSGIDLSEITNIEDLNKIFERFTNEGLEGLKQGLNAAGVEVRELGSANDNVGGKIRTLTSDVEQQNRVLADIDGIKSRVLEFFSLGNAMQLARQGIQKTFETVKELDAAMTETAVVTDFSVGDMWDELPRYTETAKELGATTLGAYETMTLFYQQGLETNEVFEIGTETMKMARIAGLEYAEATDLMTAALRGFNMELNETSATRINDVYSELAAITAADTEEIATAMTKTASIANSANMEFETTAALLSQIIETTREPAETAGTALKTIIARFTEMKKATSDLVSVDGEEISVNKVEEALKSAGVALRDVNGEFRDLDDVFLELSSKWNGLDIMTQRYVATMAAGSRQQSRFIAMMQDYDRTMELVDAAYNSTGASQQQFEKTQESLESKLNRLKDAWNEFLMGITNSKAIKFGVDALTALLEIVNKLTGNSGLAKLGVAIGALKGGQVVFNKLFNSMSKFKDFSFGEFLKDIPKRIEAFKQTGSFSLEEAVQEKVEVKTASEELKMGAVEASNITVESAKTAGGILIEAAEKAAGIEQTGAETEAVTENAGAETETAIENTGAGAEVAIENAGAGAEVAVEVSGAVAEEAIENAGDGISKIGDTVGDLGKGSWKGGFEKGWSKFVSGAKGAWGAIQPFLPYLALIAAELAIIGAAWYFSDEQVETRKLEEATKLASGLSDGLDDARNALKSVTDGKSGLESLKNELKELTAGTDEWRLKLLEVQAEENKLINQFGLKESLTDELTGEVHTGLLETDAYGNQTITQKGWQYLEDKQADAISRQLGATQLANAQVERQQFELDKVQRLEEAEDEAVGAANEIVGGTIGTIAGVGLGAVGAVSGLVTGISAALSGAAIGALSGSAVPIAGTIIGAVGGLIAGAAVGFAAGEITEEIGQNGEYQKAELQLQKEQRIAEQKKYLQYKNALKSSLSNSEDFSSAELDVVSSVNAANMDTLIEAEEEAIGTHFWNNGANKDEIKEWALNKGYTWRDGKVYDSEGNEVDTEDNEAITKELAVFRAMEKAEQNAQTIAKYLQEGGEVIQKLPEELGSGYEDFSKILSGDISANKDTVDYMAESAENNTAMAEEILKEAKTEQEKIAAIAAFTGKSEEEVEKEGNYTEQMANALHVKALETQLNQTYALQDFYIEAINTGIATMDENGVISYSVGFDEDSLNRLRDELDIASLEAITDISEGLRNAFGEAGIGGKTLFEALNTMNVDAIKETISIFEGVDFSNPIRGAHALSEAANSATPDVAALGQSLQQIAKEEYDIGSQFQYIMNSGIYDNFSKEITELVEENGKLSAKNIQEMAESSEDLALFLDQDGVSAHGLAKAFTLVQKKGLSAMKGLTTATLKAISTTRTLADVYEEMATSVENFTPAIDTMTGMDWISSSLETMQEMINNGEYGNIQLHSYLEAIFDTNIGDSKQQILGYYKKLQSYAQYGGSGFWNMVSGQGGVDGLLTPGNGGFWLTEGTTTEQLLRKIADDYELTIDGARYFLSSLTTHSLALSNELNANDAKNAFKTAYAERKKEQGFDDQVTGKKVFMSQNELNTISATYNVDSSEALETLKQLDGNTITIITDFVDEKGNPLNQEAIIDKLEAEGGDEGLASFMVSIEPNQEQLDAGVTKIVDYVKTKELLMNLGVSEEVADASIKKFVEENNGTKIDVNGHLVSNPEDASEFAKSVASQVNKKDLQLIVDTLAKLDFTAVATKLINDIDAALKKQKFETSIVAKMQVAPSSGKEGSFWDTLLKGLANSGGFLTARAKGSKGLLKDETALTGEEGTELVQSEDGTAHLVGVNGPEITSLKKGDVIYPADETKKILNGHSPQRLYNGYAKGTGGKTFNRYEDPPKKVFVETTFPTGGSSNNSSNGSSISSSDDKKEIYLDVTVNVDAKLENLERRRENGELNALEYEQEKNLLLSEKHRLLQADFNKQLASNKYRQYFSYDEALDTLILNEAQFNKVSDKEKQEEIQQEYERLKAINDELNEIEDQVGNIGEKTNNLTNVNAAIESLDRKLENNEIDAIQYSKERDLLLSKKAIMLQQNLEYELANNKEKDFFYYDEELDTILLNEEKFNQLSAETQEEVRKEYEYVKGINDELNEIEDQMKDTEFKSPEDRQNYQYGEAVKYNTSADLDSINRKRDELSRYDELIGKLPSEMQGPLSLMTGGMGMLYEAEESQVLRRREEALRQQLQVEEDTSKFMDNGKVDKDKAYYYFDKATQSYQLYEDKFAEIQDDKIKEAVMQEMQERADIQKNINDIQAQRSGGIFQKPFYMAEKSAKAMSKAFKNSGDTAKDVKDAFNDLEKALGLSEDALDKFEGKFTEAIENSGLKDKEIQGLGLLSDEQFNKLTNSKLGGFMGDNTKAFAQMLFGEGSTNGMDFAETGLGALSEMFGLSGDLLNFDMMGMGLDMFNTAKGMAEQGMQMVEKIIGYITQAVQVVVDAWTNREDYLYNFLQIIEKHMRDYEKLQREESQIEKGRAASVDDIKKNWDAQWKSLQTQLEEQTERLETRQKELERSRWSPFSLISGWDPSTDTMYENRSMKFAWDLFIGFGSAFAPMGLGSLFSSLNQLYEDYDKRVQNSYEDRLAAEQAILDIEDQRLELVKKGQEETIQFEEKVMETFIQKQQEQIDELTRLNDSISEANSKLIDTLQSNLEKMRQDRENEKTEKELGEKERRLAYLRQDTSGANAMEIKKLEEQLEDEHESYTDKLIDQKISELQEQNDKAAEQRQQQIELLQGQLEYAEKYGLYWDQIYKMLYTFDEYGNAILNPDNFDLEGNIRENGALAQLLGTYTDRIGMSVWGALADADELKYLGKIYGAFIEYNGVTGKYKNQWALDNPGGADPNHAQPEQELPPGIIGWFAKREIERKKRAVNNNSDLVHRRGRMKESFRNFWGKLFGNEEWANYVYEPETAATVTSDIADRYNERLESKEEGSIWANNSFANLTKNGKNLSFNSGGTQNYGDSNVNNYFNIGSVGESVSLDDLADRVANIFKNMFSTGNNVLRNGH